MERSKGYILLARQLLESEVMNWPPLHVKMFIWMLLKANWTDNPKTGIKRGEIFIKMNELREEMTHRGKTPSYEEVRWFFKKLIYTRVCTTRNTTRGLIVTILNYDKYQQSENYLPQTQPQTQPQTIQKEVILTKNKDIYSRVISHLNSKTGKTYRPSTAKTQRILSARLKDGFTQDDLIAVVDIKSAQWLGDPHMEKYLRPETLFGSKFEGYLNEGKTKTVKPKILTSDKLRELAE